MNEFERQGPKQPRTRSLVLSGLLVGAGILIGVVMASELGWLPFGHAVPDSQVKPVQLPQTTPPATVSIGGDRNFVSVAKAVKPAVVNIFTTRTTKGGEGPHAMPFDDPFFRRFFGEEFFRRFEVPRERKERSLGSGVIVDLNGSIFTILDRCRMAAGINDTPYD